MLDPRPEIPVRRQSSKLYVHMTYIKIFQQGYPAGYGCPGDSGDSIGDDQETSRKQSEIARSGLQYVHAITVTPR